MFIVRPKYCEVIKCLHDRAANLETNTDTNAQLLHKNTWLCWIKFKNDRCKEGIKRKHKILKKKNNQLNAWYKIAYQLKTQMLKFSKKMNFEDWEHFRSFVPVFKDLPLNGKNLVNSKQTNVFNNLKSLIFNRLLLKNYT